jgi:hypothetical protein
MNNIRIDLNFFEFLWCLGFGKRIGHWSLLEMNRTFVANLIRNKIKIDFDVFCSCIKNKILCFRIFFVSWFFKIRNLIFYWCSKRHFYLKKFNKIAFKRKYTTTLFVSIVVSIVAMEPAQHHILHSKLFFALKNLKVTRFLFYFLWPKDQY